MQSSNDNLPALVLSKKLRYHLGVTCIVTAIWLVLVDTAQFLFTEHYYIMDDLPKYSTQTTLLLLILIFSIKFISFSRKQLFLVFFIFIATLVGHNIYAQYYNHLQSYPKIKTISKRWTIQGDKVAIQGRNFGSYSGNASVKVGELQFEVSSWNDKRIVVEQPIPNSFFTDTMVITNQNNNARTIDNFEIKNPSEVL